MADGRLVNISKVFRTNNAQAPSLFCNVSSKQTHEVDGMITFSGNSALFANIAYVVEPD